MPEFDPSMIAAIGGLRERYPDTPFLTLGQTVLWDEPMKAAFCRILEDVAPDAEIVAAVHDTDYFAKLPYLEDRSRKFALVPHNDGDTRGLWSAAGELSCLFGSETVVSRSVLTENGVAFDRVARQYPGGVDALLNRETEAWGWRAIVHTEPRPLIAADVHLRDIAPALLEQLEWGFAQSLGFIVAENGGPSSQDVAEQILTWVREYIAEHEGDTLSDLYRWLTTRLWVLVRGEGTCNLSTSTSLELFRFNRKTATLPRFRFVDIFLNSRTRSLARRSYDDAVRGSGIYTLDEFGEGALPFDVVIPGRGRGTLRLHDGSIYIKTEEPITLCTGCDCNSVAELANVLEDRFGPGVALVGKAVALISMLAHEFIFVFHEHASSYTSRTQTMNAALRAAGVELALHPLLRLRYATWSALENVPVKFKLPPHLATAFGTTELRASEFASQWSRVCDEQDQILNDFKSCASPRDLLLLLSQRNGAQFEAPLERYTAARDAIHALRARAQILDNESAALRARAVERAAEAQRIEHEKGTDFRATVQPLRARVADLKEGAFQRLIAVDADGKPLRLTKMEKAEELERRAGEDREVAQLQERIASRQDERSRFDLEITALRREARDLGASARAKTWERVELERSEAVLTARRTLVEIEYQAELERLRRVRDAITVSRGLRYTNYRPSAWWLPTVSPGGEWFARLSESATAHIEEI